MRHLFFGRRLLAVSLLLLTGLVACDVEQETPVEPDLGIFGGDGWGRDGFEVYTQNLYLGGNTSPLFDPAVIADDFALLQAVGVFWNDVQLSDVPARMAEIANQIAFRSPDVVGVQEALQFATLGPDLRPDGATVIDFLGALEAAIADKGLPYEKAVVKATTSSALPLQVDLGTGQVTQYLGFTDRLAIFKRTDVELLEADSAKYAANIEVIPGQVFIERGWTRATVEHDGVAHHVVNTHLETQDVRPIHDLQAVELMGVVDALDGVTVLVGDLNSDAAGVEGDRSWTPTYGNLIEAGFADVWELAPRSRWDQGFTCCQADDLRNVRSELDERIDFVLVRSSDGEQPPRGLARGLYRANVVGDRWWDKTPSGLWPSDHAGIVATIFQPRERRHRPWRR